MVVGVVCGVVVVVVGEVDRLFFECFLKRSIEVGGGVGFGVGEGGCCSDGVRDCDPCSVVVFDGVIVLCCESDG